MARSKVVGWKVNRVYAAQSQLDNEGKIVRVNGRAAIEKEIARIMKKKAVRDLFTEHQGRVPDFKIRNGNGAAYYYPRQNEIRLNMDSNGNVRPLTIVHELAHCLAITSRGNRYKVLTGQNSSITGLPIYKKDPGHGYGFALAYLDLTKAAFGAAMANELKWAMADFGVKTMKNGKVTKLRRKAGSSTTVEE